MQNTRRHLEQSTLSDVLAHLEEAINISIDAHESIIDATIHRFESTFELFWRWLKLIILEQGIEVNFPKEVLKKAYAVNMIDDEQIWLQMLNDRNLTSHTYNHDLAISIYNNIKTYTPFIRKVFDKYKNLT